MLEIKFTTLEEAKTLSEIRRQAFLPLYEQYHDKGNPCLRGVEDITKRLNSVAFRYFTIYKNGEIVGGVLYKCQGKGPFFENLKEGEYYLQRIYIKPEFQCSGTAQKAILLCEKEFPDATLFTVDFPENLVKNRRCYEKVGFCDTGKRLEEEPGLVLACFGKKCERMIEA